MSDLFGPVMGAVLAGGAGRRVGGAKPALELAGRPLISYPLAALRRAGIDAVVVARRASALPPLDVPVVFDAGELVHPLAGILAALDHAGGRPVLVVAADMPNLTPGLLGALARVQPDRPVAAASAGGELQPLCARYSPAVRGSLARALAAQEPLRRTVDALRPVLVLTSAELVANVNTLEDLAAQRRRREGAHAGGEADLGAEAEGLADAVD